jgi:plastocyanin
MTQRRSLRSQALALIALSLVGVSLGVAACFSEHAMTAPASTSSCSVPSSTAGATIVFIRGFVFEPAIVHVKAGGSVAWVNCEPTNIPHTSTSDGGVWESGTLAPSAAFVRPFSVAGTFPYHCAVHPSMKATVIVD